MRSSRHLAQAGAAGTGFGFLRELADQAFARAAGAPLVAGNRLELLRDGRENYPAWLAAIRAARQSIHFECYIIHDDEVGREFAAALAAKARAGVRVRVIYDWLGALGAASFRLWRGMRRAGVEVRCFNPPGLDSPVGWLRRDHRKMLAVDGQVAFVTGLCVGEAWVGDAAGKREPWRDTGVVIEGPAVADIEQAFAAIWAVMGTPMPEDELAAAQDRMAAAGEVALRVVASMPNTAGVFRLDQLVAAIARRTIWLTDAYFVGTTMYVKSLMAAAMDGVDVRLLVPGSSDIPGMRAVSRAGFRGLLQAGVRIFEWTGPMLHAKTAVVDGRWARVGSTNLNLASWIGNWELDVIAEDTGFAGQMEAMYEEDLGHAVEIVLQAKRRSGTTIQPAVKPGTRRADGQMGTPRPSRARRGGTAAGVLRIGNAVGAAISNQRVLGAAESKIMVGVAWLLLCMSGVAVHWPRAVAIPVAVLGVWTAVSLLVKAYRMRE